MSLAIVNSLIAGQTVDDHRRVERLAEQLETVAT
jgi:hypothetical protein